MYAGGRSCFLRGGSTLAVLSDGEEVESEELVHLC